MHTYICVKQYSSVTIIPRLEIALGASGDGFSRQLCSLNLDHTVRQCGPGLIFVKYSVV